MDVAVVNQTLEGHTDWVGCLPHLVAMFKQFGFKNVLFLVAFLA